MSSHRQPWRTLAVFVLLACGVAPASAQTTVFRWINAAGGDFHEPANWDRGAAPDGLGQSALFDLDAQYTVTASSPIFIDTLSVQAGAVTLVNSASTTGVRAEVATNAGSTATLVVASDVILQLDATSTQTGLVVGTGNESQGTLEVRGAATELQLSFDTSAVFGRQGLPTSAVVIVDGGRIDQDPSITGANVDIAGSLLLINGGRARFWETQLRPLARLRAETGSTAFSAFWTIAGRVELAGGEVTDELSSFIGDWLAVEWQVDQEVGVCFQSEFPGLAGVLEFSFAHDVPVEAFAGGEVFTVIEAVVGGSAGLEGRFDLLRLDTSRLPSGLGLDAQYITPPGEPLPTELIVEVIPIDREPSLDSGDNSAVSGAPLGADTADFNGDGALDIVVTIADTAPGGLGSLQRLLRDPASPDDAPTFLEVAQLPVGREPSDVLALRLDDDPFLDLVVSNKADDNIMVLFGDAFGGFGAPVVTPVGDGPSSLASGDFNYDGVVDVVVTNEFDETDHWQVLTNDGMGGLTITSSGMAGEGRRPKRIKPAEVDPDPTRDGMTLDLVVLYEGIAEGPSASLDLGRVSVFRNNGDGTFAAPVGVDVGYGSADLAIADLDGDGRDDFIVADAGAINTRGTADPGDDELVSVGGLAIVYNDSVAAGQVVLAPGRLIDVGDDRVVRSLVAFDAGNDGDPDIAAVVGEPGSVRIFENTGSAGAARTTLLVSEPIPLSVEPNSVISGDFDDDGDADLAVIGTATGARAEMSALAALPNSTPRPPDFNGDGDVDGADLGVLLGAWGSSGLTDLNDDGVTDGADLGELLASWGRR